MREGFEPIEDSIPRALLENQMPHRLQVYYLSFCRACVCSCLASMCNLIAGDIHVYSRGSMFKVTKKFSEQDQAHVGKPAKTR